MRVAVVGAGVSGLAATKCCLDEGLEPTCFEQSQDIGGVWRYTEHIEAGRPSLYPSVISNTSKEMSAFSDFPFPEHFPVFLPNALLLDYLRRYTEHFGLREHIRFGWNVVTEAGGKQTSHVFDAVMVCSGNFSEPSLPLQFFPGIERFRGQYFHSRQYKHPDVFQGKRVLVVGMGNSGVDIAVEASRVAAKVMISTTRGAWLLSRVFEHGYPWDMILNTRLMSLIKTNLPGPLSWWLLNYKVNQWFNHENYGLQPENSWLVREPVLNDDLPSYILTGRITIKPGVKEFKDNSVVFHNCPEEEPIDIVVFCTGYTVSFPFLEESIVRVENKHASLYKYVFPPQLQKPTLAVLGLIKPLGAIMPVAEMQARWVSRVFKGLCQLPPQAVMEKEVNEKKKNQIQCCCHTSLSPAAGHHGPACGCDWGWGWGLGLYQDSTDSRRITVYRSVITNTSKEMSCFSDFPFPEDFPNYLPHSLTTVLSVRKCPDFSTSGRWEVVTESHGVRESHVFDAVMVFLSTRSHTWVVSRVSDQGFPMDMVSTTRFNSLLDWLLPSALTRRIKFRKFNSWFNHTNYGLASSKSSKFKIIINEELPFCLLSGAVVLKPNVKEFTESSAVFEDGTTEGNIDVVLFATGYNFSFPFLEDSVRGSIHDNRSLYNCIFPPQLEQPTLAIIGLIQLTGSIMVGSEMQARWVTGVFAGWNKLPPPSRMMAEVLKRKPAVKRNPSERENLKMSFISYVDKIAACAGVKPSVMRLLLTDPKLGLAIFFGPCSPYQYRLQGRGSWSGARAAILTQWQRSLRPLRTRVLRDSSSSSWGWSWMCLLALPAALTAAWLCSKHPQAGWSPRL
ncbi:hypothetical protein EK904_013689 [Melospiza melodia maxima]|nr:hypothetical protein EK904_013689 [Melospiza melodia maxima]